MRRISLIFVFIIFIFGLSIISSTECEDNSGFCIGSDSIVKGGYSQLNYSCGSSYLVCYPLEARLSCESRGFYCMGDSECSGNIYNHYSCEGSSVCCDVSKEATEECTSLGGEICVDGFCHGEIAKTKNICCLGECKDYSEGTYCNAMGGVCVDRYDNPPKGYVSANYDCSGGTHLFCYVPSEEKSGFWSKFIAWLKRIF